MASEQNPEPRIIVDEDWKAKVEAEREQLRRTAEQPGSQPGEQPAAAAEATTPPPAREQAAATRLPPASFLTLVETLAMQAMASLAEVAQPAEKAKAGKAPDEAAFHLEMAKHLIDTLGVLEEKTRGNLDTREAGHLEHVLHDLRMAFIHVRTQAAGAK